MSSKLLDTIRKDQGNEIEIIKTLKTYDDAYFNSVDESEILISDVEYDKLKREAQKQHPNHPYFKKVGADVRGEKVKLPHEMGSLNQIYEGQFTKWIIKYSLQNATLNISDKLDGTSCLITYKDHKLYKAYSRGNGREGHDITRHIMNMPSVPKTISFKSMDVRGECIIKTETFDMKYSDKYKNSRNMVSGCMNRKVTPQETLDDIDFVAYQNILLDGEEFKSKREEFNVLESEDFLVVRNQEIKASELNDDTLEKFFVDTHKTSEYLLDGIVISAVDYSLLDHVSDSSSLNPEHTVKFKIVSEDDMAETLVTDVEWNISKSGFFKPKIKIEPVDIHGSTITYLTGKNAKFIHENRIGKGATIKVCKAGQVIPDVVSVIKPCADDVENMPVDNWLWNETGVEAIVEGDGHPEVIFKNVLSFFETLEVDMLKEVSLRKVMEYIDGKDKSYEEILKEIIWLSPYEWKQAIKSKNGDKTYNSLQRRLAHLTHDKYMGALNYAGFGFGERRAKQLLENVDDPDDVWELSESDIVNMSGFDSKTASRIASALPQMKSLLKEIPEIQLQKKVTTSELKGVSVCMTGFRDKELSEKIESMGGKVASGVSKKLSYLMTVDVDSNSGKAKKARDYGVEIITPEKFKDLFNI